MVNGLMVGMYWEIKWLEGGGDVNLLHNTLTFSAGHHPSQDIVQLCFLWLGFDFQAEGEPLSQFTF